MAQWVMGGLVIAMGLVAAGLGVVMAAQHLTAAHRAYQRTASRSAAILEGWDAWFLDGFSGLTMGIRWCYAVSAWVLWTVTGACLIGVGIHLAALL